MYVIERGKYVWLLLLVLVLCSNVLLYHTSIGYSLLPPKPNGVVAGSLLDLVIIGPLFYMLYRNKFSVKSAVVLAATGCVLARFLIPDQLLEPFIAVTWAGIAVEAVLIAFELVIIVAFVRYMPKIINTVKLSNEPFIFSFPFSVEKYVKNNPIIHVLCAEAMVFYYAFLSWRKAPPSGITMYKNSSYIAFQIMMIHAIIIETIGIHWWLHDKSVIISIILLVLNIYSVIFFIANIQAIRLNPVYTSEASIFLSVGLLKRAEIEFDNIEFIIEDHDILTSKLSKDTAEFVVGDLEKVYPDIILSMKEPVRVTLMMGIQKEYSKIAIRSDQTAQLKELIMSKLKASAE